MVFVLFGSCIEDKFAFMTTEDACSACSACSAGRISRDVCVDRDY